MIPANRFYEQEWRAAMDRLDAQIRLVKRLMDEWKPGMPETQLNTEAQKLVELANAFPSRSRDPELD
jgi:hypothetical protein